MKYLKLYENFIQTDSEIHELCKKYGIKNYTINNGLVDVDGDVKLSNKNLKKIPIKFGNVIGHFKCYNNQLTSLEGAPQLVGGHFGCSGNQLITLEGAPESVGGDFDCDNNQLTSLEGAPKSVGGDFYCPDNNIFKLDFVPNYKGVLYISMTPFFKVWILIVNSIEKDYTLFDIFIEDAIIRDPGYQGDTTGLPIIILDRLNDFLELCNLEPVDEVEGYTCI